LDIFFVNLEKLLNNTNYKKIYNSDASTIINDNSEIKDLLNIIDIGQQNNIN
jgi:hypothetical protein